MTQNLRITGTISARYSNFTGADINISQKDLDASVGECTGTNCNSYIIPMTHKSNNKTDGTYYNFCATSAGTICSDNLMENASSDICPSNWQLSTAKHNFTASGFYNNGSLGAYGMYGYWWLSTAHSDDITIYARYDKVNSRIDTSRDGYRFYGFNVRCVTK